MAHFAKLDENNVVLEVNSVNNAELTVSKAIETINGYIQVTTVESEEKGVEFLREWSKGHMNWVQTSYNGSFRGKYAAIGDTYDADAGEFRSPIVAPSVDVPVIESVVEVESQVVTEAQALSALDPIDVPVVETQQTVVLETQAPVGLGSTDIPALTSADIQALTSEQISGLE